MTTQLTSQVVPASEVQEGDWVQWPRGSDTMRRISSLRVWPQVVDGMPPRVYVEAHSAYDDYDYEWLNSQLVDVWREARDAA